MHIEEIVRTASSFENLLPIANQAKPKLTFWGTRYIVADGYEDKLQIDELTRKFINLINENETNPTYLREAHSTGHQITKKIDNLYKVSDEQVSNSNLLTRIFVAIRECFLFMDPRSLWGSVGDYGFKFASPRPRDEPGSSIYDIYHLTYTPSQPDVEIDINNLAPVANFSYNFKPIRNC